MKKLYLLFCLFLVVMANQAYGQTCSYSLVQDTGCIPFPVLAVAADTNVITPVVQRNWCLKTCAGASVYCSANGLNPVFSYVPTSPGCYCLYMTSTDQLGQTCTYQQCNILINDTAHFDSISVTPNSFCAPQLVTLKMHNTAGCGTITNTSVQWGCGNITNAVGNQDSLTHLYAGNCNPQCYNINILVTNSCGCVGVKKLVNALCLQPKPVAGFSADVSSGVCVNSITSHFIADSVGVGFTYSWYVDGIQLQSNPSRYFTYTFPAAAGCYDIKLIVANATGCADTLERPDYICVFSAPHLSFTLNTTSLCIDSGQTGLLCAQNTSQPFLPNSVWWVRGGTPYVNLGPFLGDNVCFPIVNPGNYSVTLIGSYGPGCTDSLTVSNFTLKRNPSVCFYANDTFSCQSTLCTTFTNCTNTPLGSTYNWSFGTGGTPSSYGGANPPQLCYYGLGSRNVSLTVTSTNGCIKTLTKSNYIVIDTLHPQISISNSHGCAPLSAVLQSTTTVPTGAPYYICDYEWWVYIHNTTTLVLHQHGSAIPHTFTTVGCYDIKMQVTTCSATGTGAGCVWSTWDTLGVCVGSPPVCNLTVSPDTLCFGSDSVWFYLSGPGCNATGLSVHFGDELNAGATTYYNQYPFPHDYHTSGEFDAWVVPEQDSCKGDTLYAHIFIYPPVANFSTSNSCITGDTVCFQNTSHGANRYHWRFGCVADTFNTFQPCLLLPHCDTCTVYLTAYNDTTHCVYTKMAVQQTACGGVEATFTGDTSGCNSLTSHFINTTPNSEMGVTHWFLSGSGAGSYIGDSVVIHFTAGQYQLVMIYTAPGGCVDSASKTISVCNLQADFSPLSVCLPDSFHFRSTPFDSYATSCDSIVLWTWNFGSGVISTEENPVHYFNLGSHTVNLTVTNYLGCTASVTKTIAAGTPVYQNWSVDSNLCPGSTVCITNNTSSGVSLTENWQFSGTGIPPYSGHTPPCLTYPADGDYPLVYHVTGGTCNSYDTVMMHVHNPELCGYLSANQATCPPLAVCATNCSQNVDLLTDLYTWNFGNGSYLEENPCTIYTTPGCYPVMLSVITNNGCTDTVMVDTVCITGPHVSSFTGSPATICACQDSVHFNIGTVGANTFTFVYGCNQGFEVVNNINPVGTDQNPTFLHFDIPYCLTGTCWPQVTLGDNASGCQVLYNLPMVYVDSPEVDFVYNHYGVCANSPLCFADSTHYTLPYNIAYTLDRHWAFGDPYDTTGSTAKNPCHIYSHPGVYPVTLTIHSNSCTKAITKMVNVQNTGASFGIDTIIYLCSYASVGFKDSTLNNAGIVHRSWCYGEGYCDSTSTYSGHLYSHSGAYTVTFEVRDTFGCTSLDTQIITLNIPPYYANLSYVQNGNEVQFTNTSVGNYDYTFWTFGDGDTSDQQSPYHLYTSTGVVHVHLISEDLVHGCLDDTVITLNIPLVLNDTICGYAYFDMNNSGTYDAGDIPFAGTTVYAGPYSTVTDANGYYQLVVSAGNYFIFPDHPVGTTFTEPSSSSQLHVSLTVHQKVCNLNFGLAGYTSVFSITDAAEVKVMPNPFTEFTTIEVTKAIGEFDLHIVNLLGKEVANARLKNNEAYRLYRNKLSSGVYLIEIRKEGSLIAVKKIAIE